MFLLFVLAVLAAAAVGAIGWAFSNRILVPADYSLMPEFEVIAVAGDRVTLPAVDDPAQFARVRKEGVFNLLYEDGYGRLGPVLEDGGDRVVRAFELLSGASPRPGQPARLDTFLYWGGPDERGIEVEELTLEGEAGALKAWWARHDPAAAVLILHGRRRGELVETLRFLPALLEQDRSVLALAYRNHRGSDPSADGFYRYGASEYQDVLTGVDFLARQGVERVVLFGISTGAAVALEAIKRWPQGRPELAGIVLDSPLLDPRTVFRQGAPALPFGNLITSAALLVSRLRSGVNWGRLDQRRGAGDIAVPVLIVAGHEDGTVPIGLVEDFASRLRAPLTFHRVEGADHVESWNLDPERYERWLRTFLSTVLP